MATRPNRPKGRSIKNLRMVWGFTSRYPGHIAVAATALLIAAASTWGVPFAFKLIIDKGFAAGSGARASPRRIDMQRYAQVREKYL